MVQSNPIAATIIMIFGLQAIILIVLLFRKQPKSQSFLFLAMLLFFFALLSINIALLNIFITINKVHLFKYFQLELLFGFGPALYFLTKSITNPDYHISRKEYIHFIPVILEFIYFRTEFYRIGFDNRILTYQNGGNIYDANLNNYSIFYLVQQWIALVSMLIYIFLAVRILLRYNKWIKTKYSNLKNKSLTWLQIPVFFFSGFWILWNILTSIDTFIFNGAYKEMYFLPSIIGISVSTCWIGFIGYVKSQTEAKGFTPTPEKAGKFNSKPIEAAKITSAMESQKLHLQPDLDLTKLSEYVEMNPKTVSQIINHDLKTNFYEFVNKYRVEEFKRRIQCNESDKFSLLGLAYECGFNSKSTFNHTFKKHTGKTPREFYILSKNMSEQKHSDY